MSPKKSKKPVLDIEDQHCQRPWNDFKEQQLLQQQNHTAKENAACRSACRRLIEGEYTTFADLFGQR